MKFMEFNKQGELNFDDYLAQDNSVPNNEVELDDWGEPKYKPNNSSSIRMDMMAGGDDLIAAGKNNAVDIPDSIKIWNEQKVNIPEPIQEAVENVANNLIQGVGYLEKGVGYSVGAIADGFVKLGMPKWYAKKFANDMMAMPDAFMGIGSAKNTLVDTLGQSVKSAKFVQNKLPTVETNPNVLGSNFANMRFSKKAETEMMEPPITNAERIEAKKLGKSIYALREMKAEDFLKNYTLFHGSNKKFKEFMNKFVASGAGSAQSRGLYFTTEEEIARAYRFLMSRGSAPGTWMKWIRRKDNKSLEDLGFSKETIKYADRQFRTIAPNGVIRPEFVEKWKNQPKLEFWKEKLKGINYRIEQLSKYVSWQDRTPGMERLIKERRAVLEFIDNDIDPLELAPKLKQGAIYEVNIDAMKSKMLKWYDTIGNQSPFVQKALINTRQQLESNVNKLLDSLNDESVLSHNILKQLKNKELINTRNTVLSQSSEASSSPFKSFEQFLKSKGDLKSVLWKADPTGTVLNEWTIQNLYQHWNRYFNHLRYYATGSTTKDNPKLPDILRPGYVEKIFNEKGIHGVIYPVDRGGKSISAKEYAKGKNKDKFNFVIYDDKMINIVKKHYGLTMLPLGATLVPKSDNPFNTEKVEK